MRASAITQHDSYAGDTIFANILAPIVIRVNEHPITDGESGRWYKTQINARLIRGSVCIGAHRTGCGISTCRERKGRRAGRVRSSVCSGAVIVAIGAKWRRPARRISTALQTTKCGLPAGNSDGVIARQQRCACGAGTGATRRLLHEAVKSAARRGGNSNDITDGIQ